MAKKSAKKTAKKTTQKPKKKKTHKPTSQHVIYALQGQTFGRPSKYRPEYCQRVVEIAEDPKHAALWSAICAEFKVDQRTIESWKQTHEDFRMSMRLAAEIWETKMTNFYAFEQNSPKMYSLLMSRHRNVQLEKSEVSHTHTVQPINEIKKLVEGEDEILELD